MATKQLNSLQKGTNRTKFLTFRERLSLINIDVHRRVDRSARWKEHERKASEKSLHSTSSFADAVERWADLNCTKHFEELHYEIRGLQCIDSLPLLLHHRTELVDLLLRHLKVENSLAIDAIVDLLTVLAQELRQEFYVEFERVMLALVELLDPQRLDQLECVFICIASLFKHLLRQLIGDVDKIFDSFYYKLLAHSRPFVREFAAEAFAFVLRKVPAKNLQQTLSVVLHPRDWDDDVHKENYAHGQACAFFELVKGLKFSLHSCSARVLPLLPQLAADSHCFTVLQRALQLIGEHVRADDGAVVCDALLVGLGSPQRRRMLVLLDAWMQLRGGSRVCHRHQEILQALKTDTDDASGELLQAVGTALLALASDTSLKIQELALVLLSRVLRLNYSEDLLQAFVKRLTTAALFTSVLQRQIIRDIHVYLEPSKAFALLDTMSSTINDGSLTLTKALRSSLLESLSTESAFDRSLSIVPLLKESSSFVPAVVARVEQAISVVNKQPTSRRLSGSSYSRGALQASSNVLSLLSSLRCLRRLASLDNVIDVKLLRRLWTSLFEVLQQSLDDPFVLACADELARLGGVDDAIDFSACVKLLHLNLCSRLASTRLNTLRLLDVFPAPTFVDVTSKGPTGFSGRCTALEEMWSVSSVKASLGVERDVSRTVRRLSSMLASGALPASIVPLIVPFLLGILRVKFQFLWKPAQKALVSALQSHADVAWPLLLSLLDEAAAASSIIVNDSDASDDNDDVDATVDVIKYECTDSLTLHDLLLATLGEFSQRLSTERSEPLIERFLVFMRDEHALLSLPTASRPALIASPNRSVSARLTSFLQLVPKLSVPTSSHASLESLLLAQVRVSEPPTQRLCVKALHSLKKLQHCSTLLALLDAQKCRDTLTLFSLARDGGSLCSERQRQTHLPIILRIVESLLRCKSNTKGAKIVPKTALFYFLSRLDDAELHAFVVDHVISGLTATSHRHLQVFFVELLPEMLVQLGHRLEALVEPVLLPLLLTMTSHHGRIFDDDKETELYPTPSLSVLHQIFVCFVSLCKSFPSLMASSLDRLQPLSATLRRWSCKVDAEFSQQRNSAVQLIVSLSASVDTVALVHADVLFVLIKALERSNIHQKLVGAIVSIFDNLVVHAQLSADLLTALLESLSVRLEQSLTSGSTAFPSAILSLLANVVPLVSSVSNAHHLVQLLLPHLSNKDVDVHSTILRSLTSLVPTAPLDDVNTMTSRASRLLLKPRALEPLLALFDAVAQRDVDFVETAALLRDLNAFETVGLERDVDYTTRAAAFMTLQQRPLHQAFSSRHVTLLLYQLLCDLRLDDVTLRGHAALTLSVFAECIDADDGNVAPVVVRQLLLPELRRGVALADALLRRVNVEVLVVLVKRFPLDSGGLDVFLNAERQLDVLSDLVHLQAHRRRKGLARAAALCESKTVSSSVCSGVLRPIALHALLEGDNTMVDGAVRCLGALAGAQNWTHYKSTLLLLSNTLSHRVDATSLLLKAFCGVVDRFAFDVDDVDVHDFLVDVILPKLYTHIRDTNKHFVRLPVVHAIVRVLQRLPETSLRANLPRLISVLLGALGARLQRHRDEARRTLAQVAAALGAVYLQYILKEMRLTLVDGFRQHVLAASLLQILQHLVPNLAVGQLDYCLDELVDMLKQDMFGAVAETREVDAVRAKTAEAKRSVALPAIELIASVIDFERSVERLVEPFRSHLVASTSLDERHKCENALAAVAAGVSRNPSATAFDKLVYAFVTMDRAIAVEANGDDDDDDDGNDVEGVKKPSKFALMRVEPVPQRDRVVVAESVRATDTDAANSALCAFALALFAPTLKTLLQTTPDAETLHRLSPFLPLLTRVCARTTSSKVALAALRTVPALLRLRLSSATETLPALVTYMLDALTATHGVALVLPALRGVTTLLTCAGDVTEAQLELVLSFVKEHMNDPKLALGSIALLRAVMTRRLSAPLLYEIFVDVAELIVTSANDALAKLSERAFVAFLLDYPMTTRRLEQHLTYFLTNLRSYPSASGRASCARLLATVARSFPSTALTPRARSLCLPLVDALLNDVDVLGRSAAASALQTLLQHAPSALRSLVASWIDAPNTLFAGVKVATLALDALPPSEAAGWKEAFAASCLSALEAAATDIDALKEVSDVQKHWPLVYELLRFVERAVDVVALPALHTLLLRCVLYPHAKVRLQTLRVLTSTGDDVIANDVEAWADALVNVFRGIDVDSDASLIDLCSARLLDCVRLLTAQQRDVDVGHVLRRLSMRLRADKCWFKKGLLLSFFTKSLKLCSVDAVVDNLVALVAPLLRLQNATSRAPNHEELENLIQQLMDDLKAKVGAAKLLEVYDQVRVHSGKLKEDRRRQRVQLAVVDPEAAAQRKEKKTLLKKRQRQLRMDERKKRRRGIVTANQVIERAVKKRSVQLTEHVRSKKKRTLTLLS